jgi:isoleucyl-tRNA synthetase
LFLLGTDLPPSKQVHDTYVSVLAPLAPLLAEEIHHFAAGATADPAKGEEGPSVFEKVWVEAVRSPLSPRQLST